MNPFCPRVFLTIYYTEIMTLLNFETHNVCFFLRGSRLSCQFPVADPIENSQRYYEIHSIQLSISTIGIAQSV
jgi:hypothetical protein